MAAGDIIVDLGPRAGDTVQSVTPWVYTQGRVGINKEAQDRIKEAGLDETLQCGSRKPMWHQNVLGWLTHHSTPFKRLLVVWQMGLGKTQGMLRVLDNYFDDTRPKLVLVPSPQAIRNFYADLVRWDSRYKHWLLHKTDLLHENVDLLNKLRNGKELTIEDITTISQSVRQVLESRQRGKPRMPGDIRAFTFTHAGGKTIMNDGIMKSREEKRPNSLDNCIIVVDEAHQMYYPEGTTKNYQEHLDALRKRLQGCHNSILVMFTGTPLVANKDDAKKLMAVVQGSDTGTLQEGYVSYFIDRPHQLFAKTTPEQVAFQPPAVHFVSMSDEIQQRWKIIRFGRKLNDKRHCLDQDPLPKGCMGRMPASEYIAFDTHQQGRRMNDIKKENAAEMATKFNAIAKSIVGDDRKTVVMIHKSNGFDTLVHVLKLYGLTVLAPNPRPTDKKQKAEQLNDIAAFNSISNKLGEENQVIVLYEAFNVSVSLRNVRRLIFADLSPGLQYPKWAEFQQRIARSLRQCGHNDLPLDKQTLEIEVFIAIHTLDESYPPTLDCEKWLKLLQSYKYESFRAEYQELCNVSIDGSLYSRKAA